MTVFSLLQHPSLKSSDTENLEYNVDVDDDDDMSTDDDDDVGIYSENKAFFVN